MPSRSIRKLSSKITNFGTLSLRISILVGASVLLSGMPARAAAPASTTFYYLDKNGPAGNSGTGKTGTTLRLVSVDPVNNVSAVPVSNTGVDSPSNANQPNGFAYDGATKGVFYTISYAPGTPTDPKLLYFSRPGINGATFLGDLYSLNNSVTAGITAADIYNNKYIGILQNTSSLVTVSFNYIGGLPSSISSVIVANLASNGLPAAGYGDIAINANTGILYGSTVAGEFYSIDLNNSNNYTLLGSGLASGLQLSFNSNYSTLYGVDTANGMWYSVSLTDGTRTLIPGFTSPTDNNSRPNDLAGAEQPVPGPVPLLGGLAAFHASRRMRRRIQVRPVVAVS